MTNEKILYLIAHREMEPTWKTRRFSPQFQPTARMADYYKIGITVDAEKRLRELQNGTPHKLELVTTIKCDDAKAVEAALHDLYSHGHQRGEWYSLTLNAVNSLRALEYLSAREVQRFVSSNIGKKYGTDVSLYVAIMQWREATRDDVATKQS